MKRILFVSDDLTSAPLPAKAVHPWLTWVLLLGLLAAPAQAADRQVLQHIVPAAATNTPPLRQSPRLNKLNLSISLPLRDRPGLTNLLQQLYDPASANFRHYLT